MALRHAFTKPQRDLPREECCECGEYTGKAGRGEDSLYCAACGDGPFCPECFGPYDQCETCEPETTDQTP